MNYNFTSTAIDKSIAPEGVAGVFLSPALASRTVLSDEVIPIGLGRTYHFSYKIREMTPDTSSRFYSMLSPYDIYGLLISPGHYMFVGNTTTTLAQELKPGDTFIKISDPTNWHGTAERSAGEISTHLRRIILWDYVDPGGKAWPEFTYSRNISSIDAWADGAVSTDGTIELRNPWPLDKGTHPAGTKVSNGMDGGAFLYREPNVAINSTATAASGRLAATIPVGKAPPGMAQVKVGWLLNRDAPGSRHAIADVLLSEAPVGGFRAPTPDSATSAGVTGEVRHDSDYLYICIARNTWRRVAISSW